MIKLTKRKIIDYSLIVFGTFLTALSIALFLTPAQLAPGGVSGIATIFYYLFGFDTGISIFLLSVPLFLLAIKFFGKNYGLKSLVPTVLLSVFTSILNIVFGYDGILNYSKEMSVWLSALYGGVIMGFGLGFVIKAGSNTGGTDILALLLSKYTHMAIGTTVLIVDSIIITASAFIFSIEHAMYAIVVTFILSIVINKIILSAGTSYAKTVYIISDKLEEIGKFILEELDRGGTIIPAKGLYSKDDKNMLMTVIPNQNISKIIRFVHDIDSSAFLVIEDTHHVLGEGFTPISKIVANNENDVTQN